MISTEDAWNARARERDRTPAINLEDDREVEVVVRMLGAVAARARGHQTIMAHMIDPVVVGYGGERGLPFEEQMTFLLGKGATYFELAYFLKYYNHVMSFVEELLNEPQLGYDFIDGVHDALHAHKKDNLPGTQKSARSTSYEETDAGTAVKVSVEIQFGSSEGESPEEVMDAVTEATQRMLPMHNPLILATTPEK